MFTETGRAHSSDGYVGTLPTGAAALVLAEALFEEEGRMPSITEELNAVTASTSELLAELPELIIHVAVIWLSGDKV